MAKEMRDYLEHREKTLEARVAKLEAFAEWVRDVAGAAHADTGLALRRIADEARAALQRTEAK